VESVKLLKYIITGLICFCVSLPFGRETPSKYFMIFLSSFIPFLKKHASLPELFSRDAVLEELGVLPEDIQGENFLLTMLSFYFNLDLAG